MRFSSFQFALLFVPLIFSFSLTAQITGLWEITSVTVGHESMTPIAKWTHIHEDGTYESGNGWLQNSKGTYTYDAQANTYLADDSLGLDDPYGPFTVDLNGEEIILTRKEVTVSLKRINEKQMAPADKICGAWDLVKAELGDRDGTTDMDPNDAVITLMRWDRTANEQQASGS